MPDLTGTVQNLRRLARRLEDERDEARRERDEAQQRAARSYLRGYEDAERDLAEGEA